MSYACRRLFMCPLKRTLSHTPDVLATCCSPPTLLRPPKWFVIFRLSLCCPAWSLMTVLPMILRSKGISSPAFRRIVFTVTAQKNRRGNFGSILCLAKSGCRILRTGPRLLNALIQVRCRPKMQRRNHRRSKARRLWNDWRLASKRAKRHGWLGVIEFPITG